MQKEEKSLGEEMWQRWEITVFCWEENKLTIWKTSALSRELALFTLSQLAALTSVEIGLGLG